MLSNQQKQDVPGMLKYSQNVANEAIDSSTYEFIGDIHVPGLTVMQS